MLNVLLLSGNAYWYRNKYLKLDGDTEVLYGNTYTKVGLLQINGFSIRKYDIRHGNPLVTDGNASI